jgi:tetratricopeptide (TPR) repeat protein/serine/threonine protein kinase
MNERELFMAALQIEDTAGRSAYLDRACGGELALRRRVEALLAAFEQAGSFLQQPAGGPGATSDASHPGPASGNDPAEGPGTVIGPYQLIEQIGEGGMGTVYRAQQTAPVRRLVALKVIKPGMDTRQVVARFEAERQALALMDHPNIAKVLDGGTTDTARPYFVMELVKGVPITRYCDEHRLTPRQRLELFVPVCQAVQHAHQKGIIHRDLKPSNVLVALYDDRPVPKVIDFGVAKAAGQPLTEQTLHTGFGAVVGTLEYMSPEQTGFDQLDVDMRSDIYSLGVMLYELLTGGPPFSRTELAQAGALEFLRLIREQEPTRPSTKLSTAEGLPTLAASRGTEPRRLAALVRGELDWIVMKALEKDRNRRYETAGAFAADVQHYLADEPVQACPPSAWYRFRKFARRNKASLAAAASGLAVILALAGSAIWFGQQKALRQARTERTVTAALSQAQTLVDEGDKQIDNPKRWQETARLAQAALQRGEDLLAEGLGTDELAARVRQVRSAVDRAVAESGLLVELDRIRLEEATVKSGKFDEARAAPLYAALFANYGLDLAEPQAAAAQINGSRLRDALLAALEEWSEITPDAGEQNRLEEILQAADPPDTFRARWLAAVRRRDGPELVKLAKDAPLQRLPTTAVCKLARDLRHVKEWAASERVLRTAQEVNPGDFWLNHDLGFTLMRQGRTRAEEAVGYLRVALALRSDSPGVHLNLGHALQDKGDLDGAVRKYQAALEIDPHCSMAHSNLGRVLHEKGDLNGALREYRAAVEADPKYAMAHNNLGAALQEKGDLEGAIQEYHAALKINPKFAPAHYNLANILRDSKDLEGAIQEYRAAVKADPDFVPAHINLGIALFDTKDFEAAIQEYRAALAIEPKRFTAHHNLANALKSKGDLKGAIQEYRAALEIKPDSAETHCNLGNALQAKGKLDEAISEWRKASDIDPKVAQAHYNLGVALADKGKVDEAIACYQKAIEIDPRYAEAHCNLGDALRRQGRLTESLESYRRGHALGFKRPDWSYPSLMWVRQARRLVRLEKELPDVLSGKRQPASEAERVEYASVCLLTKRYQSAARLYAKAFTAEPKLPEDLGAGYRYNAACAAALSGCGQGKDADKLDDRERTRLRRQALTWLRADLVTWRKQLESDEAKIRPVVQQTMQHWLRDTDFAGVRGPEALAKLPQGERQDWPKLWADVKELFTKAGGKSPGPGK